MVLLGACCITKKEEERDCVTTFWFNYQIKLNLFCNFNIVKLNWYSGGCQLISSTLNWLSIRLSLHENVVYRHPQGWWLNGTSPSWYHRGIGFKPTSEWVNVPCPLLPLGLNWCTSNNLLVGSVVVFQPKTSNNNVVPSDSVGLGIQRQN